MRMVCPTLEDLKTLAEGVAMEGVRLMVLFGLVRIFTENIKRNMNKNL